MEDLLQSAIAWGASHDVGTQVTLRVIGGVTTAAVIGVFALAWRWGGELWRRALSRGSMAASEEDTKPKSMEPCTNLSKETARPPRDSLTDSLPEPQAKILGVSESDLLESLVRAQRAREEMMPRRTRKPRRRLTETQRVMLGIVREPGEPRDVVPLTVVQRAMRGIVLDPEEKEAQRLARDPLARLLADLRQPNEREESATTE